MRLTSLLDLSLLKSEAFSPFLDRDVSVVVGIASLKEWLDAGLHWDDWSGDWDQLVVGDGLEIVKVVTLSVFNSFETLLLQIAYLEEPVSHTLWELSHVLFGAFVKLLALSKILQMDFGIGGLLAFLGLSLAQASLTVEIAEGGEGLVVVGADLVHRVPIEFWAL
ncbi:hypothetical protein GCK72_016264 [Caenorhabditis remanei]|uniref:Uncharacterized protein n=1 Tax=Caenorhabditis remanei TaxID=31234 RepID=A0A6A5GXB7_CAERE|nr:hypothetical protein GCK72_016264 [Caenorhabditis remanei]KAF1759797.1 hypothetical protein GCK72_016264 [Caenorhabditis remanei]